MKDREHQKRQLPFPGGIPPDLARQDGVAWALPRQRRPYPRPYKKPPGGLRWARGGWVGACCVARVVQTWSDCKPSIHVSTRRGGGGSVSLRQRVRLGLFYGGGGGSSRATAGYLNTEKPLAVQSRDRALSRLWLSRCSSDSMGAPVGEQVMWQGQSQQCWPQSRSVPPLRPP